MKDIILIISTKLHLKLYSLVLFGVTSKDLQNYCQNTVLVTFYSNNGNLAQQGKKMLI